MARKQASRNSIAPSSRVVRNSDPVEETLTDEADSRASSTASTSSESPNLSELKADVALASLTKRSRRVRRALESPEVGFLNRVRISTISVASVAMLFCAVCWPNVLDFRAKLAGIDPESPDVRIDSATPDSGGSDAQFDVPRDEWREQLDALYPRDEFSFVTSEQDAKDGYGSLAAASEAFDSYLRTERQDESFDSLEPNGFDVVDAELLDATSAAVDASSTPREFPYMAAQRQRVDFTGENVSNANALAVDANDYSALSQSSYVPANSDSSSLIGFFDDALEVEAELSATSTPSIDVVDSKFVETDSFVSTLDNPLLADLPPVNLDDPLGLDQVVEPTLANSVDSQTLNLSPEASSTFTSPRMTTFGLSAEPEEFDAESSTASTSFLASAEPLTVESTPLASDDALFVEDDGSALDESFAEGETGYVTTARYDAPDALSERSGADIISAIVTDAFVEPTASEPASTDAYVVETVETEPLVAELDVVESSSENSLPKSAPKGVVSASEAALAPSYFSRAVGLYGGQNSFSAFVFARATKLISDEEAWSPDPLSNIEPISVETSYPSDLTLDASLARLVNVSNDESQGSSEPLRIAANETSTLPMRSPSASVVEGSPNVEETTPFFVEPDGPDEDSYDDLGDPFPEYPEPTLSTMHTMYPTLVGYVERTTIPTPVPLAIVDSNVNMSPTVSLAASKNSTSSPERPKSVLVGSASDPNGLSSIQERLINESEPTNVKVIENGYLR